MEERKISVEGKRRDLPDPFFILATENPVEFEGTFPLPEAQKDRFFLSLRMGYPPPEAEEEIMIAQRRLTHPVSDLTPITDTDTVLAMQKKILEVEVSPDLEEYILALVDATRQESLLQLGASPRAAIALYKGAQALASIRGRTEALMEDIREITGPVLLKRITVKSENLLKGITEEGVVKSILERTEISTAAEAV
jgi:MoxR-like ATPase